MFDIVMADLDRYMREQDREQEIEVDYNGVICTEGGACWGHMCDSFPCENIKN